MPGHSESFCNFVPRSSKQNSTRPATQISEGILGKSPTLAPTIQVAPVSILVDPPESALAPTSTHPLTYSPLDPRPSVSLGTTQNLLVTESAPPANPVVSVDQATPNSVTPQSITFQASVRLVSDSFSINLYPSSPPLPQAKTTIPIPD